VEQSRTPAVVVEAWSLRVVVARRPRMAGGVAKDGRPC
jgi:hypothetical protein